MIDPRQRRKQETSYVKTFGVTSSIVLAGLAFHRKTITNRQAVLSTISKSIEKMKRFTPSMSVLPDELENEFFSYLETTDYPRSGDSYDPYEEWRERIRDNDGEIREHLKDFLGKDDDIPRHIEKKVYDNLIKDMFEEESSIIQSTEDLRQRIRATSHAQLFPDISAEEASESMADNEVRITKRLKDIEKDYPGMNHVLDELEIRRRGGRFKILDVKTSGLSHVITVHDGLAKHSIELPKLSSGIAMFNGSLVKPSSPASIGNGFIDYHNPGRLITMSLEDSAKFQGNKELFQIKRQIENSISSVLYGGQNIQTGHEIKHLLTQQVHITKYQQIKADSMQRGRFGVSKDINKIFPGMIERSRFKMRDMDPERMAHLMDKGSIISMSEMTVLKNRVVSEIPFGIYPGTPMYKASQARANFMSGIMKRGIKSNSISAKLGPMSETVLSHLEKNMLTDLPGGMTNMSFISGGKLAHSGPGGMTFILRERGQFNNAMKYAGGKRNKYVIPLYSTQMVEGEIEIKSNKSALQLILQMEKAAKAGKPFYLKDGRLIGRMKGFKGEKIDGNSRVYGHEVDEGLGLLTIHTETKVPLHIGTKFDQGKLLVNDIVGENVFSSGMLAKKSLIRTSIDGFTEADSHTKFKGGAIGMGAIQKIMSDLSVMPGIVEQAQMETKFRRLVKEFLGSDADNIISSVKIDQESGEPIIKLARKKGGILTTSSNEFMRLLDVESAITEAYTAKDFRKLNHYQKKIDDIFGKGNYRLYGSESTSDKYVPIITTGIDPVSPDAMALTIRTPLMQHEISQHNYTNFSSSRRTLKGWGKAFRATADHYENAYAARSFQYVKYLDSLLDYNAPYIADKMSATLGKTYIDGTSIKPEFGFFTGSKVINLKEMDVVNQLAEYSYNDHAMKVAGKFRVLNRDVSGLQGTISDEAYLNLLNTREIPLEDLRDTTRTGLGRFSVDITDKSLVDKIMEKMFDDSEKKALYLELPDAINVNGVNSKVLPIHRFDTSDIFEMEARMTVANHATKYKQRFYTGSQYFSNQMAFFKKAAEFEKTLSELDKGAPDYSVKKRSAVKSMEIAAEQYYSGLKTASKGKFSTAVSNTFETTMPFSMRSLLNFAEHKHASVSSNMMAKESAAIDSVFLYDDDAIKLVTNGKVSGVKGAKEFINSLESVKSELNYLNKQGNALTSMTDVGKANEAIYDMFSKLNTDGMDKQSVQEIRELRGKIRKYGKELRRKVPSVPVEEIVSTHKEIKDILSGTAGTRDHALSKAESVYKYAVKTIEDIKSEKLTIMGRLVGSPELSPLSSDYARVKIIEERDVLTKGLVSISPKDIGKNSARIFATTELAKKIARDFDADPIAFLITTLDVLENQANTVNGFSILADSEMKKLIGGDLTRNLTHETVSEAILSKLFIAESETGVNPAKVLRPASMTSVTLGSVLSEVGNIERLNHKSVSEKVGEYVDLLYPNLNSAERAKVSKSIEGLVSKGVTRFRRDIDVQDLRVLENVIYREPSDPAKVLRMSQAHHQSSMHYPEKIAEFYQDALSEIDVTARDKVLSIGKQGYLDFRDYEIEKSERFRLIKETTPEAYNLMKSVSSLNLGYSLGEREASFMLAYADKIIAQNTISSKHGTPQILPDIKRIIRNMSSIESSVSDAEVKRLADGNLHLKIDDYVKKDMDILKMGTDSVDMNYYEEYLAKRGRYLSDIRDIHNTVIRNLNTKGYIHKYETHELEKMYRDEFNIGIAKSHLSEYHGTDPNSLKGFRPRLANPMLLHDEIEKNAEAIKAVSKVRGAIGELVEQFIPDEKSRGTESLKMMRKFQSSLRLYAHRTGYSVMDDPNFKVVRSFAGPNKSDMSNMISGYITQLNEEGKMYVSTGNEARIAKVAELLAARKNSTIESLGESEKIRRLYSIRKNEIRIMQRDYADRLAGESSVFRTGSIIQSVLGRTNRITESAMDDMVLHSANKSLRTNLLTGLFIGTIMGQAFNQVVSGYSVPDLQNTTGLGGEYYDRKGGVFGNQNEVFIPQQPPRVTPASGYEHGLTKSSRIISDLGFAQNFNTDVRQYQFSRKGAYVR